MTLNDQISSLVLKLFPDGYPCFFFRSFVWDPWNWWAFFGCYLLALLIHALTLHCASSVQGVTYNAQKKMFSISNSTLISSYAQWYEGSGVTCNGFDCNVELAFDAGCSFEHLRVQVFSTN